MFLSFFIMFMFTVKVIINMNVQGTNMNKQHATDKTIFTNSRMQWDKQLAEIKYSC